MEKLLVVVDMQADFISGALGSEAARAVVAPVAARLAAARAAGERVIFTADTHPQAEYDTAASQESRRIPSHCVAGTSGHKIAGALTPGSGELVVEKPSFLSLTLHEAIGPLADSAEIELCGVCTDICVISNALHLRARYPNNRVTVLAGLCAGTSEENHNAALAVMKSCLIDIA